jgi:hypothetical protein
MPNINDITLAGAVANCTHGTNIEWGTFSDLGKYIQKFAFIFEP